MLFLQPPFHIIEGVAVFGDHASERQYYFMPAMPRLTTVFDPEVGHEIPQIQLLKFKGGTGGGGLLTFAVNLGFEEERLDTVAMELKRIHHLDEHPLLAPIVLENGTVRLMAFGRESSPDGQPSGGSSGDTAPPRFVLKLNEPASPALYGDNQAIFSVELDEEGVQLAEASLQSDVMQIGVIYALDFLALRPAFSVSVDAKWDRIQTHFEESFGADIFFASTEIETVIDKLIEDRVVEINVDSFLPEGEDSSGSWVGRRDQAINDFKDMVLDSFFEPSIDPMKEEEDNWDRFTHTAERLSLLAATGGWGGVVKFKYTKRDLTRIDQKRINLKMNERVTVRRSIYPQALLSGLSRTIRDAPVPIDISRFVKEVRLDSDWFRKREVIAHGVVNFAEDEVESVTATLTYGDRPQTVRLTANESSATRDWNSIIANNAMKREVELEYQVHFKNVDTSERPGIMTSPKRIVLGDEFNINPRGERLYFIDDIKFGSDPLPWDRYPNVMVEARYNDPTNGIRLAESFMLSEGNPDATWKRFRMLPEQSQYEVRLTYFGADNRDIVIDWTTSDQERMVIRDPRPDDRVVTVVPAVSWGLVTMVLVDLSYVDDVNGVRESKSLSFLDSEQDRGPKTFSVHLVDPEHRLVNYSATILLSDNRVIKIPPSATEETSIFVRSDMLGHRIVTVQTGEVNFAARGIVRMEADLAYADPDAGLSFEDRFTFQAPGDRHLFEFDYVTAEKVAYTCHMRTLFANGLLQERDLGSLRSDKVVLPAV